MIGECVNEKNALMDCHAHTDVTYGENVKVLAVSLYSEGVMSNDRIASFLNAVGNGELGLSEGSIYGFCRESAEASEIWVETYRTGGFTA